MAFIAYPGLLGTLAIPNFWALIFFLMLVTLGVDSVFGMWDFVQQFLLDSFPIIQEKMRKEYFLIMACMDVRRGQGWRLLQKLIVFVKMVVTLLV